jgi:hypothetical protein
MAGRYVTALQVVLLAGGLTVVILLTLTGVGAAKNVFADYKDNTDSAYLFIAAQFWFLAALAGGFLFVTGLWRGLGKTLLGTSCLLAALATAGLIYGAYAFQPDPSEHHPPASPGIIPPAPFQGTPPATPAPAAPPTLR